MFYLYNFFKIIHIISVISFMAGILYLPRLYVYHSMEESPLSDISKKFQIMEKKLIRYIINPAFIVVFISGLFLSYYYFRNGIQNNIWLLIKFLLFLIMGFVHMLCSIYRKKLIHSTKFKSTRFFRFFNEAPTIIMILIVILVVLKPF